MATATAEELPDVVQVNDKLCKLLVLHDGVMVETVSIKGAESVTHIPGEKILAVHRSISTLKKNSHYRKFSKKYGIELEETHAFIIYSAFITNKWKWRVTKHEVTCSSAGHCESLISSIQALISESAASRPRNLFVIINPCGGRRKGKTIYQEVAAPLFDLAEVKTEVIVTERAEDARCLIMEKDLTGYDGVISVGGDGTFAEVANALILKAQYANDLDPDDPDTTLLSPDIPIGIIPAGSTDVMVYGTTGVNDPMTSTLQIIMGNSLGLDVCSVHHNNHLLRYTVSFLGYGFFGDVIKESENFRWMGPKRYDIAGFLKYIRNKSYYGEVSFLPSRDENHSPWDMKACRAGCNICKEKKRSASQLLGEDSDVLGEAAGTKESEGEWQHVRGTFKAVNAAVISGVCAKVPNGISPAGHLGNGCVDLMLVRKCSRLRYLHLMLRMTTKANHFNFDFVDVYRVKAFRFQTLPTTDGIASSDNTSPCLEAQRSPPRQPSVNSTSSWNLDGEIGEQPDIDVRVHCQLIKLFARGPESPQTITDCMSCYSRQRHVSDD